MSAATESLCGTPETDAILCVPCPSTTATTTKEQGSRAPSIAQKHSLPLKQFQREQRVLVRMHRVPLSGAAVTAVIGEGWAGSDAVRSLRREGRTEQVTAEPSLPCCRRPSLCGVCPGPPAGSPGTAEALRAESAWRRGPWSLESNQS